MAQRRSKKFDKELLKRIRERFRVMSEADQENRRKAMEDFKFVNVPGFQWDDNMRQERGNRPCYEFNKLRVNGKRVINEVRSNRPQGKVRPVEGGDTEQAELREGLCRNIWSVSDGDSILDYAAEYVVDAGMGAWRVDTEYSTDDTFDQDIVVRPIKNPFCLYVDPACKDFMKRDAEDWILTEMMAKSTYEAKYPNKKPVDFEESEFDDDTDWDDDEHVRIAEYWYKEPHEKEIWLVQFEDEQITVDSESDEAEALLTQYGEQLQQMIVRTRKVKTHKIMSCIVSGDAVLEPPEVRAGKNHRFIMVYGEHKVIDGRHVWHGLHRFSKDAQQSYNIARTSIDETIATAPKQGFWATPVQAEGLTDQWAIAHKENLPFRLYNPDSNAAGAPKDYRGADVPVALMQQAVIGSQDIRDTSGLHEASFGEESQEKSGIALARKQGQAAIVTYNFPDNIGKAIQRTLEIMLDLIPEIYDAERELRILGEDGAEDYKRINQIVFDADGTPIRVNDMSAGKYDVTITIGPSYSTMRQEAAEVYGELGARNPELMQVAGDLVFKSLDYPYADEIAERWKAILPPAIQKMIEKDGTNPEVQAAMAQAEQAMQLVQAQAQQLQQAGQKVQQEKSASEKQKSEVREAMAKLETQQARFEADVAKKIAEITTKQAQLQSQEAQLGARESSLSVRETISSEKEKLAGREESRISEIDGKLNEIDELVADYITAAQQVMASIDQKTVRPKFKGARVRRENGQTLADIEFDDGSKRTLRQVRENGELRAEPVE